MPDDPAVLETPADPHALRTERFGSGVRASCACGQWEAVWTTNRATVTGLIGAAWREHRDRSEASGA